ASADNVTLTFDDFAAGPLPFSTQIFSGTFLPSNYGGFDLPAPAPPGPYGSAMSVFDGTDPNGPWRLFVNDCCSGHSGAIAGGWGLTITMTNVACSESCSPRIAAVQLAGVNVQISFVTVAGRSYRVERTDNLAGSIVWTVVS